MNSPKPFPVLFLVGPTGTGKSDVALRVAKKLGGEIVSADSMQVYRGMDIGTGKPDFAQRRQVPHHLLDICVPSRLFSVVDFHRVAFKALRGVQARGRLPIVVGGSGLYVRALLQGLDHTPAPDYALRKKLQAQVRKQGVEALYQRLRKTDPKAAVKIKPTDERRIIRALEVAASKGKRRSPDLQPLPSLRQAGFDPVVIGLQRERPVLYKMIETRVDKMFRRGWAREAQKLARGRIARTARQALGYRHLWSLGKNNRKVRADAIKNLKILIKRDTRRFAKRQWTWFRREPGIRWLDWQPGISAAAMAARVCSLFLEA